MKNKTTNCKHAGCKTKITARNKSGFCAYHYVAFWKRKQRGLK